MVQMKVRYDDAIDVRRDGTFGHDIGKIGKSSFIVVSHVHATVEHDVLPAHAEQNATTADILASAERRNFDLRHSIDVVRLRSDRD